MSKDNCYNESMNRLREFLKEKEESRKDWAKEKWSRADGEMFRIGRILVPILSFIGMISMILVCLIRFVNIPEIGRALANSEAGLNNTAVDDSFIYPFFALVFISLCLLVYTAIRFIKGKYQKTPCLLFFNSLFLSVCALLRYCADQGTFPDNSNYDGAPTFTYFEYCMFTLVVFAILMIYGFVLLMIARHDKREFNRNVEHVLNNVILPKDSSGELLTEEQYAKLIDEYLEIEKEKQEIGTLGKKEAKKRKKELQERTKKN